MEESKVKTEENSTVGPATYIETIYGTRTFARALMFCEAQSIMDLMQDFSDHNNSALKSHITKLEARNKELEEALCSIKQMKGKCLGVREVGKESIKIAEQALKQV